MCVSLCVCVTGRGCWVKWRGGVHVVMCIGIVWLYVYRGVGVFSRPHREMLKTGD